METGKKGGREEGERKLGSGDGSNLGGEGGMKKGRERTKYGR